MSKILLIASASLFGNISADAFFMLQIKTLEETDSNALLLTAISAVTIALVTIFFIYRKEVKERNICNEQHAQTIQKIYEKVVLEANSHISNTNRLTNENIQQVKELREAIQRLPSELRRALKD